MINYFTDEINKQDWDGHIYMRDVKETADIMQLTKPLPCGEGEIPAFWSWDGSSSGPLRNMPIIGFPKWKHPIASCRHDFRCAIAKTKEERKIADKLFRRDVGIRGTKWEQIKGYLGVRIGAMFGVGSDFEED
jgi:hypothetical protein